METDFKNELKDFIMKPVEILTYSNTTKRGTILKLNYDTLNLVFLEDNCAKQLLRGSTVKNVKLIEKEVRKCLK